jgi:transcriptional regulator with XRE-family HTH domain
MLIAFYAVMCHMNFAARQTFRVNITLNNPSCQRVDIQLFKLTKEDFMRRADHAELASLIGRTIARQRRRSGLTQEEVAERLEICNEAVSRIERGLVIPNIARLLDFASIFGCEVAELLTETSPHPTDQAVHINRLLASMRQTDRQLVIEIIERLSERLTHTSRQNNAQAR